MSSTENPRDTPRTADDNAAARLARLDELTTRREAKQAELDALLNERRAVIHDLFYLDGIAAQEIADRMAITPQMVRRLAYNHSAKTHQAAKLDRIRQTGRAA